MDGPLNVTQQRILEFLLRDALECGKVDHFDPGWISKRLDLHELEMQTAARGLAELDAVSIHEFRGRLTDIVIKPNAASLMFGPKVKFKRRPCSYVDGWAAYRFIWSGLCGGTFLGLLVGLYVADSPGWKWMIYTYCGVLGLISIIPEAIAQTARAISRYRSASRPMD